MPIHSSTPCRWVGWMLDLISLKRLISDSWVNLISWTTFCGGVVPSSSAFLVSKMPMLNAFCAQGIFSCPLTRLSAKASPASPSAWAVLLFQSGRISRLRSRMVCTVVFDSPSLTDSSRTPLPAFSPDRILLYFSGSLLIRAFLLMEFGVMTTFRHSCFFLLFHFTAKTTEEY